MKALITLLSRHPWIFVVLAFVIMLGALCVVTTIAVKYGPEEIELKKAVDY